MSKKCKTTEMFSPRGDNLKVSNKEMLRRLKPPTETICGMNAVISGAGGEAGSK